jgi:hypothetical protein
MIIGDDSSSSEEDGVKTVSVRQSVKDTRMFFERISKGGEREHTPDFKPSEEKKQSPVKIDLRPTQNQKMDNKLKALMATKKSVKNEITPQSNSRPNIFTK